jgi:hypothetical protein
MKRTISWSVAAAAMLSVAAGTPAAAQSGLYDYPGGYAGRFDGVSPGAAKQKGQAGANQTVTVEGKRTISVGAGAKRRTSDPDRPVVLGTVPNPKSKARGDHDAKLNAIRNVRAKGIGKKLRADGIAK